MLVDFLIVSVFGDWLCTLRTHWVVVDDMRADVGRVLVPAEMQQPRRRAEGGPEGWGGQVMLTAALHAGCAVVTVKLLRLLCI